MSQPETTYDDLLDLVLQDDVRYPRAAYLFVERALQYFRESRSCAEPGRHITGPQLLVGVREFALHEFGPMARTVLNAWNLGRGEDIGEIVYNMIRVGLMSKTDEDRKEDFAGVMAFDETMDRESSW